MSFFDKKQDVIDVQLTRYGKRTLARGNFRPVYYEFFDDDILYNGSSAGIVEVQSRAQERIFESQRLKTFYSRTGIETELYLDDIAHEQHDHGALPQPIENPNDKMGILKYPLRECAASSPKAPYFAVTSHASPFLPLQSSETITVNGLEVNIPQIEIKCKYELEERRVDTIDLEDPVNNSFLKSGETYFDLTSDKITFLDKSQIKTYGENLTISISEENASFSLEDFELEVYEVIEAVGQNAAPILLKLRTEEKVNKYFNIKTDKRVFIQKEGE